jgi:hypothetical protein
MKLLIYGTTSHSNRLAEILMQDNSIEVIDLAKQFCKHAKARFPIFFYIERIKKMVLAIYKADLIYTIFMGNFSKYNFIFFLVARILKKTTINHWIGTDVLIAKKNMHKCAIMQKLIKYNYCGSKILYDELKEINIKSEIVPIVLQDIPHCISKMPDNHKILVYLPQGREVFYGLNIVKKLIYKFKDIEFYIVGNDSDIFSGVRNVKMLGHVSLLEMNNIYDRISILLRIPEHDGLSLMLLEALAKGKYVIYKYEFPYTFTARSYEEAEKAINIILKKEKKPIANKEASEYIVKNYSTRLYINKILEKMHE